MQDRRARLEPEHSLLRRPIRHPGLLSGALRVQERRVLRRTCADPSAHRAGKYPENMTQCRGRPFPCWNEQRERRLGLWLLVRPRQGTGVREYGRIRKIKHLNSLAFREWIADGKWRPHGQSQGGWGRVHLAPAISTSSTRRFLARPCSEALLATGEAKLTPTGNRRSLAMP